MVTTEVLAAISSPGFMVRPMILPPMEDTAEQFARFFSAVSSPFWASSRLCWAEKISASLSSPSTRTKTCPAATWRKSTRLLESTVPLTVDFRSPVR